MIRGKKLGIQHFEAFYDDIAVFEKELDDPQNYYRDDDEGYITDTPLELPWKPYTRNNHHDKTIGVRDYIQLILEKDIDETENNYDFANGYYYELVPSPMPKSYFFNQYKIKHKKNTLEQYYYKLLDQKFHDLILHLHKISYHLHYLHLDESRLYITVINLFIYLLFFMGWVYILSTSFSSSLDIPRLQ